MNNDAEVVIIGAGVIGVSIAYNLARLGVRNVIVVEKSIPGSGSTAAALGGFRHQFSSELSIRMSIESTSTLERLKELTGYDPQIRRDGYLFLASSESSLAQLKRNRALQVSLGVPVVFLESEELVRKYPFYSFEGVLGGTFCNRDGHALTSSLLQGFISKAKQMGVTFIERTEVRGIDRTESRVKGVKTAAGEISTRKVVIAAGAFSGQVGKLALVRIPVTPYPRKILFTHPFNGNIPQSIPIMVDVDTTLAFGRDGSRLYFSDNGPVEPGFEPRFPLDFEERVVSKATRRVPALRGASIAYHVSGLYEMTPDSNPIACEVPDVEGLYCCAGFAGHGFMHAPAIGELMAELITGRSPHLDISSLGLDRFEKPIQGEQLII